MTVRTSAGIVLYRRRAARTSDDAHETLQALLAHPGGPFFARKDIGAWTIPKGLAEPGETLEDVALRELAEETGHRLPPGVPMLYLASVRQRNGKTVHAWAVEDDMDPARARSNTFELEWPPGSGMTRTYPEVDRVAWFDLAEARRRIAPSQAPFIDRLEAALEGAGSVSAGSDSAESDSAESVVEGRVLP